MNRGEQPVQVVMREVLEETVLRIESEDPFATMFETWLRHIDVIFRVVCDRQSIVRVTSEATGHAWLPLKQ